MDPTLLNAYWLGFCCGCLFVTSCWLLGCQIGKLLFRVSQRRPER